MLKTKTKNGTTVHTIVLKDGNTATETRVSEIDPARFAELLVELVETAPSDRARTRFLRRVRAEGWSDPAHVAQLAFREARGSNGRRLERSLLGQAAAHQLKKLVEDAGL
jgi:hypothetical protein